MRFWLFKSEPDPRIVNGVDVSYSLDALKADGVADWDGASLCFYARDCCLGRFEHSRCVKCECCQRRRYIYVGWWRRFGQSIVFAGVRNYQARNNMMEMKVGDKALFYHSNTKIPGVVGTCEVVRESYADETAWDSSDPHFDPKTDKDKPRWFKVDIRYTSHLPRKVSLAELKTDVVLSQMQLFTRARLSVCEITKAEWHHVNGMAELPEPPDFAAAAVKPRRVVAAAASRSGASRGEREKPAAASLSAEDSLSRKQRQAVASAAKRVTPFAKYAAGMREKVSAELGGRDGKRVALEIAKRWKALSAAEKRGFG